MVAGCVCVLKREREKKGRLLCAQVSRGRSFCLNLKMGRKRDRLDAVPWPPRLPVPTFHLDRLAARGGAGAARYGDAVAPPETRVKRGPRCGHLVHAVRHAGELRWRWLSGEREDKGAPAKSNLSTPIPPPLAGRAAATPLPTFLPSEFVARPHHEQGAVAAVAVATPPPSAATDADTAAAAAAAAAARPPPSRPPPASAAFHPPPPPPGGGLTPCELEVVREARAARRSWADVAALLPWRSAAGIKKMWLVATGRAPPPPPRGRPPSAAGAPTGRPAAAASSRVVVDGGAGDDDDDDDGETRVALKRRLGAPPPGTTVAAAHGVEAADGAIFYGGATVVDGDDDGVVYEFEVVPGERRAAAAAPPPAKKRKLPRRGSAPDAPPPPPPGPPPIDPATAAAHGACFNVGVAGADGTALLSWAQLIALYRLPDGTSWAETCCVCRRLRL